MKKAIEPEKRNQWLLKLISKNSENKFYSIHFCYFYYFLLVDSQLYLCQAFLFHLS